MTFGVGAENGATPWGCCEKPWDRMRTRPAFTGNVGPRGLFDAKVQSALRKGFLLMLALQTVTRSSSP